MNPKKPRVYTIITRDVVDGSEFTVARDEKWRFMGLSQAGDGSAWLVFVTWKIDPEFETSGIVWGCG